MKPQTAVKAAVTFSTAAKHCLLKTFWTTDMQYQRTKNCHSKVLLINLVMTLYILRHCSKMANDVTQMKWNDQSK